VLLGRRDRVETLAVSEIVVRAARPHEASELSELAVRSKSHWGYDDAFLRACRSELAVAPDDCDGVHLVVADCHGVILGFAQIGGERPIGELKALFVDLGHIGTGVGGRLLDAVVERAARAGFSTLLIDADPGAESFYLRAGATRVGETPSGSIPGRMLPRLRLKVNERPKAR
jgi:GNAT superfamily N-acetyltransferase